MNYKHDPVNHPVHYTSHPSGVECIDIVKHMGFNLGNVIKYVWRADLKGDALEDLKKAKFYLECELGRREKSTKSVPHIKHSSFYDEHTIKEISKLYREGCAKELEQLIKDIAALYTDTYEKEFGNDNNT